MDAHTWMPFRSVHLTDHPAKTLPAPCACCRCLAYLKVTTNKNRTWVVGRKPASGATTWVAKNAVAALCGAGSPLKAVRAIAYTCQTPVPPQQSVVMAQPISPPKPPVRPTEGAVQRLDAQPVRINAGHCRRQMLASGPGLVWLLPQPPTNTHMHTCGQPQLSTCAKSALLQPHPCRSLPSLIESLSAVVRLCPQAGRHVVRGRRLRLPPHPPGSAPASRGVQPLSAARGCSTRQAWQSPSCPRPTTNAQGASTAWRCSMPAPAPSSWETSRPAAPTPSSRWSCPGASCSRRPAAGRCLGERAGSCPPPSQRAGPNAGGEAVHAGVGAQPLPHGVGTDVDIAGAHALRAAGSAGAGAASMLACLAASGKRTCCINTYSLMSHASLARTALCRCLTHLQIVTNGNLMYTLGNGSAVTPQDVQWSASQWIASVCAYGKPLRSVAFVGYRCDATRSSPAALSSQAACPPATGIRAMMGMDPCAPAAAKSKYVTYDHVSCSVGELLTEQRGGWSCQRLRGHVPGLLLLCATPPWLLLLPQGRPPSPPPPGGLGSISQQLWC